MTQKKLCIICRNELDYSKKVYTLIVRSRDYFGFEEKGTMLRWCKECYENKVLPLMANIDLFSKIWKGVKLDNMERD